MDDLGAGALAQSEDGDHRRHADDDAQRGLDAAALVGCNGLFTSCNAPRALVRVVCKWV